MVRFSLSSSRVIFFALSAWFSLLSDFSCSWLEKPPCSSLKENCGPISWPDLVEHPGLSWDKCTISVHCPRALSPCSTGIPRSRAARGQCTLPVFSLSSEIVCPVTLVSALPVVAGPTVVPPNLLPRIFSDFFPQISSLIHRTLRPASKIANVPPHSVLPVPSCSTTSHSAAPRER